MKGTSSMSFRLTSVLAGATAVLVIAGSAPSFSATAEAATTPATSSASTPISTTTTTSTSTAPKFRSHPEWSKAVLAELNKERAAHHLKPLTVNDKLSKSAHTHAVKMAKANTLSHQLKGEAGLGDRVTKVGYRWTALGENIGMDSRQNKSAAVGLQVLMYSEKAPYDGHRRNILSKTYRNVGIDVLTDSAHHRLWLVTDFGRN